VYISARPVELGGSDFWTGAGTTAGAGFIGFLAHWFRRGERLEAKLDAMREKIAGLEKRDARVYIVETCLRLVVVELKRVDPDNEKLHQVATILTRAVPMDRKIPDEMGELLDLIEPGMSP
jgi:hypothetical protein